VNAHPAVWLKVDFIAQSNSAVKISGKVIHKIDIMSELEFRLAAYNQTRSIPNKEAMSQQTGIPHAPPPIMICTPRKLIQIKKSIIIFSIYEFSYSSKNAHCFSPFS
jgi:hypothetical protein